MTQYDNSHTSFDESYHFTGDIMNSPSEDVSFSDRKCLVEGRSTCGYCFVRINVVVVFLVEMMFLLVERRRRRRVTIILVVV